MPKVVTDINHLASASSQDCIYTKLPQQLVLLSMGDNSRRLLSILILIMSKTLILSNLSISLELGRRGGFVTLSASVEENRDLFDGHALSLGEVEEDEDEVSCDDGDVDDIASTC